MSVDKFGRLPKPEVNDAPSTNVTINPINKYAMNLDSLENVEGFNEPGIKDNMYAFKLNEQGIYVREEIDQTSSGFFVSDSIKDQPITLVFTNKKWIPIPYKRYWDINIILNGNAVTTKGGNDHTIITIMNSGTIIGGYRTLEVSKDIAELQRLEIDDPPVLAIGCKKTSNQKHAILDFKTEFNDDQKLVQDPPVGSTFIIEGYLIKEPLDPTLALDMLEGFKIKYKQNGRFVFIITRLPDVDNKPVYNIKNSDPTVIVYDIVIDKIHLDRIFIAKDTFVLTRIRYTTKPVTPEEIQFL